MSPCPHPVPNQLKDHPGVPASPHDNPRCPLLSSFPITMLTWEPSGMPSCPPCQTHGHSGTIQGSPCPSTMVRDVLGPPGPRKTQRPPRGSHDGLGCPLVFSFPIPMLTWAPSGRSLCVAPQPHVSGSGTTQGAPTSPHNNPGPHVPPQWPGMSLSVLLPHPHVDLGTTRDVLVSPPTPGWLRAFSEHPPGLPTQ